MPSRSAKPCGTPGCKALVRGATRCPEHTRAREQARGSSTQRGYDGAWRALRAAHLSAHPMCVHPGCVMRAQEVDHVIAHKGDDALRLDPDNLQSLCHGHHSQKTVAQDGGLGRARVVIEPGIFAGITYVNWSETLTEKLATQDEEWEPSV